MQTIQLSFLMPLLSLSFALGGAFVPIGDERLTATAQPMLGAPPTQA
jgi:hypothetical protein